MRSSPSCNIEQASNGGHTVYLRPGEKAGKGMDIHYTPPTTKGYGPGDHEQMMSDVRKHLGIGKKAPKMAQPSKTGSMAANMGMGK